ncbi:MAG: nitrite reductase large subunit NirB [Pseudomonadota bacterium]
MKKQSLLVVGNGMVGHHFLESIADGGGTDRYDITVLCGEERPAYDRVHLSEFFSGRSADDLSLVEPGFFDRPGITLRTATRVEAIDTDAQSVSLESGESLTYDKLVLATGSFPFVPPIPGNDGEHCFVYRTINDLEAMRDSAASSKIGVVVGGGLLGLEAANALSNLGLETHVVEFAPRLMPVQLDDGGGTMLKRKITELGITVHCATATERIVAGDSARYRMEFASGESLETDLICFSAGIRPWDQLGRDAGLEIGERGGIVVDNQCQTSADGIYAIGECALWGGRIFGLVAPGYQMARVAAAALLEQEGEFTGADMSTKLKLLGVDVCSIGDAHGNTEGSLTYSFCDELTGVYRRINVSDDGKTLLGAILVGDADGYEQLLQYCLNGIALPSQPDALILPARDGAGAALAPGQLPATATVCSCHNVSKGDIVAAIDGGCLALAEVKEATSASTGCGGCAQMLKDIVDDELALRGVEISTALCEHFEYTRQELFHLVRVEKIRTFAELLERHGRGRGCDICKPTVASILAAQWNDYVLEKPHVGLQDTNDRYLANMQKDGSYSVVPRVPGGEITPKQLIAIGQVGEKYNLYTKITGGQRIDLFGARLEELPSIWEELIAAGLETGHAYGKAMRTVKSCVGSTWCRYGVQDSVAMALRIENRYKGLRAPHKIELAVSGCTRECAEAQSKDVGVIATENGWNLFVGGNGGMKPRHADLFAVDLDDETLIRYIDRFLMFYVATADRLQRTARWLENLDGGLDYIRQVVIEDSLGIAAELEDRMEAVVGTYQCEWTTTLADPERLRMFTGFVNSDQQDDGIVFVEERGQIRPARPEERETAPPEPVRFIDAAAVKESA